jgi:hypothetical protein
MTEFHQTCPKVSQMKIHIEKHNIYIVRSFHNPSRIITQNLCPKTTKFHKQAGLQCLNYKKANTRICDRNEYRPVFVVVSYISFLSKLNDTL